MSGKRRKALAALFKRDIGRAATRDQLQVVKRGLGKVPIIDLPSHALITALNHDSYKARLNG